MTEIAGWVSPKYASGDITCFATQSLSGGVSGSGTVSYRGNPKNIEFSRKGLRKL